MPVNLFDVNYYRTANSNLRGLNDADATSNFWSTGLAQGLRFSPLVDLSFYRASNSDLAGFSNQQLFVHLSDTGIVEGRKFSPVFDLKFYREKNSDLANFDNEQLFNHYRFNGLLEGRNASPYITYDGAPSSFESATLIATSPIAITYRDAVGDNDQIDVYKLQLDSANTNLNVVLTGLSANADLQLLDANGAILSSSTNSVNAGESITYNTLNSGIFYIRVYQASVGQNTNYNLSVSGKLLSNEVSASSSSPVVPVAETPTQQAVSNSFLDEVLRYVNIERANTNSGLQPLVLSQKLNEVAYSHSQDMALSDYFSHTGADGSSPQSRATKAGYQYSRFGENIAAGYVSPKEVVDAWMTSPGHRANILNANYKELGVGYYYLANDTGNVNYNYYWTQNFGTVAS